MIDDLTRLEQRSIHYLREAHACFRNLGMLWSIGKDSTVLLWLARKAFFGHVPFPLVHVDTSYKIPEMILYRDRLAREWGLTMLVGRNAAAIEKGESYPAGRLDRVACCRALKTLALQRTLSGEGDRLRLDLATGELVPDTPREPFEAVILGIRADEEGTRAKERVFSPRGHHGKWEIEAQPPELWNQFKTDFPPGTHIRVHPLLDWTEVDVWRYIEREAIPTVALYYDQGEGRRYRSLGCSPCTSPIDSKARTPAEIVAELTTGGLAGIAERSGRAQDAEDGGGLERLRRDGYM